MGLVVRESSLIGVNVFAIECIYDRVIALSLDKGRISRKVVPDMAVPSLFNVESLLIIEERWNAGEPGEKPLGQSWQPSSYSIYSRKHICWDTCCLLRPPQCWPASNVLPPTIRSASFSNGKRFNFVSCLILKRYSLIRLSTQYPSTQLTDQLQVRTNIGGP